MRLAVACSRYPVEAVCSPSDTLRAASADGFAGVEFPSARTVSASLAADELTGVAREAAELGMGLQVGVGSIATPEAVKGRRELTTLLDACARAGAREVTAYTNLNRDDLELAFEVQFDRLLGCLDWAARAAAGKGMRLNLETHEDLTSVDVLAAVHGVGPALLGVNLDLANLVVNGEDPVSATRALAPYVRQTQLEDVLLAFTDAGLLRRVVPCGQGIIDWAAVVGELDAAPVETLALEQHNAVFTAAVFNAAWRTARPSLSIAGVSELVRHAVAFERSGEVPAATDRRSQLLRSAAHLRSIRPPAPARSRRAAEAHQPAAPAAAQSRLSAGSRSPVPWRL